MAKDTPAPTSTRQKIEELQRQIASLKSGAIDELKSKIKEAKALVADLERELTELTGSSVASPEKQKRVRRPSFTDQEIHSSVRTILAENPDGISAAGIAKALGINYPRITKYLAGAFLKDPKVFRKAGVGSGTKLFLQ